MGKNKIIGLIIGFATVALTVAIFLMLTANNKYSSDNFSYELKNNPSEIFYSNKNANGEMHEYSLTITTPTKPIIEKPVLEVSANVLFTCVINNNIIEVVFNVITGSELMFNLKSANYQDYKLTFSATEYVQKENLSLAFDALEKQDGSLYVPTTENNRYVLYLVDQTMSDLATRNGFANKVTFSFNNLSAKCTADYFANASSGINLENNTLTAVRLGNASLHFVMQDGSGVQKTFYFVVKLVPITEITNLPERIDINTATTTEFLLPDYSVLPSFATGNVIELVSSNPEVFNISNNTITATGLGEAFLSVYADGNLICSVLVNVFNAENIRFGFQLSNNVSSFYGNAIQITDNTISITSSQVSGGIITLEVYVSLLNAQPINSKIFTSYYYISGSENLYNNGESTNVFPGGISSVAINFYVLNQVGKTEISFKNSYLNITENLIIIVS